jgi:hypothetical protein
MALALPLNRRRPALLMPVGKRDSVARFSASLLDDFLQVTDAEFLLAFS